MTDPHNHGYAGSDGCLSAEDREALDQVYISHLKKEIERLRDAAQASKEQITAQVLLAMSDKVGSDTYRVSHALKINKGRAEKAAESILSLLASQPSPAATVETLNEQAREHPRYDNPRDPFASPGRLPRLSAGTEQAKERVHPSVIEMIHQRFYRCMYNELEGLLPEDKLTGEIWLATKMAAEDILEAIATEPQDSAAKIERLEKTIDLLEANAKVQARLLADTGRERDQLRAEPQGLVVTDAMVNAAAREMWNDRDARMGGSWSARDPKETVVIQTKATARAALTAALALSRPQSRAGEA